MVTEIIDYQSKNKGKVKGNKLTVGVSNRSSG
jgi:hypothetical protein